jgi:tRNA-dihydrouridine synthase A
MTQCRLDRRVSVAPMMDYTDRHCRYLLRLLSPRSLLYTEMVTAHALVHGHLDRLLGFDHFEHPVALQLGGSDPALLARAASSTVTVKSTSMWVARAIACRAAASAPA